MQIGNVAWPTSMEKLNLERQKLLEEVNAPLKRSIDIVEAEMPVPKRARKELSEEKPKPILQKPELEKKKPAPKYKQQKMSDFFKKIWNIQIASISNEKRS